MLTMIIDPLVDNAAHTPFNRPSFRRPHFHMTTGDIGILKSTLLPSFTLYSSLSAATYVAALATNRVELKDWLWPSSQVFNVWWNAIGRPMYDNHISFNTAWTSLSWTEKVLLSCVSIWGSRLFARIVTRSVARGKDDPRYAAAKMEPGFWRTAIVKIFLPEACFLSVISLPFTLPFRMGDTTLSLGPCALSTVRALGVAVFSSGFALEVMADTQLELHQKERTDLCRHGVWGLVRIRSKLFHLLISLSAMIDILIPVQLSWRHTRPHLIRNPQYLQLLQPVCAVRTSDQLSIPALYSQRQTDRKQSGEAVSRPRCA